jgi:hypothetical protein
MQKARHGGWWSALHSDFYNAQWGTMTYLLHMKGRDMLLSEMLGDEGRIHE